MTHPSEPDSDRGVLRAIAVYKFVKSILLALLALTALELVEGDHLRRFAGWLHHLPLAESHHLLHEWLVPVSSLTAGEVGVAGALAAFYALLFGIEGMGLWRARPWAEYLTLIATASLVPLEAWACFERPTVPRVAALLVNLAIVAVLVVFVRKRSRRQA